MEVYWPVLEPLMWKVIDHLDGQHHMGTLLPLIMQGEIQMWAVVENREIIAVFSTEIMTYPTGMKTCAIRFAAGTGMRRWVDAMMATIENHAAEHGCERVETFARKGWAKYLGDYKMTHVLLRKELR